jgi:esterase/lipase superfamily enzyme
MRKFFLTLAAVALALIGGGADISLAQGGAGERIDRVSNRRLTGSPFADLRGLSYQLCERRCLANRQCMALEHVRGGATGAGASHCRLFSSFGASRAASDADIGYKRASVATDKAPPPVARSAPKVTAPPPSATPAPRTTTVPSPPTPESETKSKTFAMKKAAPPPVASAPPPPPASSPPPTPPGTGAREESARAPGAAAPPVPTSRSAAPKAAPSPVVVPTLPPAGAAASSSTDWDVVPVYFGTDRKRRDQPKRIGYGTDRGHRLEVGRAMVTVPKAHQVPNVERPWAIRIPYTSVVLYQQDEDPKRHFTIQEIKALSKEELLALIRERLRTSRNFKDQALVFVHGYNNLFDDALYRTAQIAYDLKYDGAPFLYSWPSGAGIAGYPYDSNSAQQAEQYFSQFLQMVLKETGAKNVSIIAHSMGNQLLLQTLRNLDRSNPEVARINQIILAAPDVDRDGFQFLAGQIRGIGQGITMYASSNDVALGISRRFAGGVPRAGDVPAGLGPIVVSGIDTIDVSALSTEYLSLNHSSYAEKTGLLKDIELVLRTGVRPPEIRLPVLLRIKGTAGQGDYWRYPK